MTQQQVQQEAVRLSNQHQLGVLQKEYGWNTCGVVFLIVFFTLWIGMILSFFLIGIEYQGRVLPWSDFDRLNMSNDYGTLSIPQKGSQRFLGFKKPWATLSYIQIPNLAVLHHLTLSITGSANP
jgi:hypothetical protein